MFRTRYLAITTLALTTGLVTPPAPGAPDSEVGPAQFSAVRSATVSGLIAPQTAVSDVSAVLADERLYRPSLIAPPSLAREFRGAWIATIGNLDWPSKAGLPSDVQQRELLALLDRAVSLRLNAVILQVRPAADALYASTMEPWSLYLSGEMGRAPEPYYDPLEFAVSEAHKRGLELHAWFNPFRALSSVRNNPPSSTHLSKTHPELVRRYGDLLWLDPGEEAVRDHVIGVITDVVRRYNIDGVHLDDYFYPYPMKDARRRVVDFPDDASWARYAETGGLLERGDWRRENVNLFVERLYKQIKAEKPWVQFGIAPFGIWRPQKEPLIFGLDAYDELYADSRKWLENGWVDYISPQLYWTMNARGHGYATMLQWWAGANPLGRHLWPGVATSRIGPAQPAADFLRQIALTRLWPGSKGNIHWHIKTLTDNLGEISNLLSEQLYAFQALAPASPWLGSDRVEKPEAVFESEKLSWKTQRTAAPKLWALQTKRDARWTLEVLPGEQTTRLFDSDKMPEALALTPIDRFGNAGPAAMLERVSTTGAK